MRSVRHTREIEARSSAVTMSDMELFIFPELLYAMVLANIMSPRIWKWREDPWFEGAGKMKPYRKITRLKQFIMDHYVFNLDLDTWGLTTKECETARFADFIDMETLKKSNALFGYEGDKYYFDIGIRQHFGLDKYEGNIIPYWKTETVEAMDAFRFKPNYGNGAGECVSLSTLYAASLFLVGGIPLKDIFLMATPLHSQNYIDIDDGILTNNRRLVTKNMWFNGTALSAQARRALENENVTIVAHESGLIHMVYKETSIDPADYRRFSSKLRSFLKVRFAEDIFGNFLRQAETYQKCFQVRTMDHGISHYVAAERVFAYEHAGPYQLTDSTREKLMQEIEKEEFQHDPLPERMILNDLEEYIKKNQIDLDIPDDVKKFKSNFCTGCLRSEEVIDALIKFCHVQPSLPEEGGRDHKPFEEPLGLDGKMSREEMIARLESIRGKNRIADLAFYAYRDLNKTDAEPFVMAGIERNPVSLCAAADMQIDEVEAKIRQMPEESVYDEQGRLAQPDEVWNYARGDGIEKALLLANVIYNRKPGDLIEIKIDKDKVILDAGSSEYEFLTKKRLGEQVWKVENLSTPDVGVLKTNTKGGKR